MYEASIILPVRDNSGNALTTLLNRIEEQLMVIYGGVTIHSAKRSYIMDNGNIISEPVHIVTVAVPKGDLSENTLRQFAARFARDAGQETVYLRLPDGHVEFIGPGSPYVGQDLAQERKHNEAA